MKTVYRRADGTNRGKAKHKQGGSRQLVQLLTCLAIFLTVFVGKGIWPSQVAHTGVELLEIIRANTDFRAAFTGVGRALSEQDSVLGELGEFCVAVFAPETAEPDLDSVPVLGVEEVVVQQTVHDIQPEEIVTPALQVGDVVQVVESTQELPEGYSGQWLWLGDVQATVPVMGKVTSGFGYRDHPTIGRHAPHGGVDISAGKGERIAAFADGVVETVGEDSDFGHHLTLNHGNGVSTFYAHCSSVCVEKGDTVRAGQQVAQVGSTGKSTGPHLHFEVRLNGVRLDPLHYIRPEQEV